MVGRKSLDRLKELGTKRILIQIPEGLKTQYLGIMHEVEKEGFQAVLSVEPCFGACDIRDSDAKMLSCDALLHIGHSDFGLKSDVPVVYDEWRIELDAVKVIRKNMGFFKKYRNIGLLSTVQYAGALDDSRKAFENDGMKAFIGKSGNLRSGQVLGCDFSNAKAVEGKVNCFLFIGSGKFHSQGLMTAISKPLFYLDAERGILELLKPEPDKAEVKRQLRIEKARGLKRFAVFVSTKPGQRNIKSAAKLKEVLSSKGKDAIIISADTLSPDKILGMGFQVLVNTACPRIYDDQKLFGLVILNAKDVMEL